MITIKNLTKKGMIVRRAMKIIEIPIGISSLSKRWIIRCLKDLPKQNKTNHLLLAKVVTMEASCPIK
jgi:hypothetical protein